MRDEIHLGGANNPSCGNLNFQIAGVVLEQADIPRGQERDYQPITLRLPRYSAVIGKGDVRNGG